MTLSSAAPAVHYLGRTLTRGEVDARSRALSAYLAGVGVGHGDRVLLQLQNMPQAVIACLASWRLGAAIVPVNPMYKAGEVGRIVADCRPAAAIVLDELYGSVLAPALEETGPIPTVTTGAAEFADPSVAVEMDLVPTACPGTSAFADVTVDASVSDEPLFDRRACSGNDLAALVYTSGTTGPPKGAMVLHRNLDAERDLWARANDFKPGDVILGVAPYFHITGLVADLTTALDCAVPLVQLYRFEPATALRWIEQYRPSSVVAAITAYTALLNEPGTTAERLSSLRTYLSGGAPVSPATVEWWRTTIGGRIRNCYGLTETSTLVTLVPPEEAAPVDPVSGALSVGRAVAGTSVLICDDADRVLPPGEAGEVVISGPQVVAGYWEKPQQTAASFGPAGLRTGDVGFLDGDGWLYLIDRSKDLIVTSGYKVWPREVEDLLLSHPAIAEAGVVGIPDDYRGEQVVAYVTLRPGTSSDEAELIAFCRERIAVFKAPRRVTIMSELPKTASGKILRRELRKPGKFS